MRLKDRAKYYVHSAHACWTLLNPFKLAKIIPLLTFFPASLASNIFFIATSAMWKMNLIASSRLPATITFRASQSAMSAEPTLVKKLMSWILGVQSGLMKTFCFNYLVVQCSLPNPCQMEILWQTNWNLHIQDDRYCSPFSIVTSRIRRKNSLIFPLMWYNRRNKG